jgi:hypothetical protein
VDGVAAGRCLDGRRVGCGVSRRFFGEYLSLDAAHFRQAEHRTDAGGSTPYSRAGRP